MKLKKTSSILIAIIIFFTFLQSSSLAQIDDESEIFLPFVSTDAEPLPPASEEWSTVAANQQRTSLSLEEVSGNLDIKWYRPIEAYISQNVQLIASNGMIYVSTARGLYALDANDGSVEWRYDTELPLGNSPTIHEGVLYVGGYDRKLHALNAANGQHLWSFNGAKAGYDTNPLVVDGKVILGNRDGAMYAIGAHNSAQQGQLIWKYQTGGAIHLSAAYTAGKVYFASNDSHAYALDADNGTLAWKSQKLPGDGFQSYWPVIYRDMVIFSVSSSYRHFLEPGMMSVEDGESRSFESYYKMERDILFGNAPDGTLIGEMQGSLPWTSGKPVIDVSRLIDYFEDYPWRRSLIALDLNTGIEHTYDADNDGRTDYLPVNLVGTNSGNRYPPIVGSDNVLYQSVIFQKFFIPQVKVMGWIPGTDKLSVMNSQHATDEPLAISAGGNVLYSNLCCDRIGRWTNMFTNGSGSFWHYYLEDKAPGYDEMWTILDEGRTNGWYQGATDSNNSAYHNHGNQNALIPYNGNIYAHRSNAIVAFGPEGGPGKLPLLTINDVQDNVNGFSQNELIGMLESEIQKIVDAGHLRPGYYNGGLFHVYGELANYFENPGDTLYVLSIAYPYLSPGLQQQVENYLRSEFDTYFDSSMFATTGWDGAAREAASIPPDVEPDFQNHGPQIQASSAFAWSYPQHNFYGMWKYATIFPQDAVQIYSLAKGKLQVPVPSLASADYFQQKPYELNAWIAGYIGFLELQELANMDQVDAGLRSNVTNELDRLLEMRVNIFTPNSYWTTDRYLRKQLDIARNFMFLVPELGEHLRSNLLSAVDSAIEEYNYVAPYWFVSRYEAVTGEGAAANLYNYHGLFMAKAYIMNESQQDLIKYLDVPAFARGDLLYLQNLIAAIQASENLSFTSDSLDPFQSSQNNDQCNNY